MVGDERERNHSGGDRRNTAVLEVILNTTLSRIIIIQIRTTKGRILTGILWVVTCMRLSLGILKLNTTDPRTEIPWRTILIPITRFRRIIGICATDMIPMNTITTRTIKARTINTRIHIIPIINMVITGMSVMVVEVTTNTITTIRPTMIDLRRDTVRKRIKVDSLTDYGISEGIRLEGTRFERLCTGSDCILC